MPTSPLLFDLIQIIHARNGLLREKPKSLRTPINIFACMYYEIYVVLYSFFVLVICIALFLIMESMAFYKDLQLIYVFDFVIQY